MSWLTLFHNFKNPITMYIIYSLIGLMVLLIIFLIILVKKTTFKDRDETIDFRDFRDSERPFYKKPK